MTQGQKYGVPNENWSLEQWSVNQASESLHHMKWLKLGSLALVWQPTYEKENSEACTALIF